MITSSTELHQDWMSADGRCLLPFAPDIDQSGERQGKTELTGSLLQNVPVSKAAAALF